MSDTQLILLHTFRRDLWISPVVEDRLQIRKVANSEDAIANILERYGTTALRLRLLGTRENADVLCTLYEQQEKLGEQLTVEVGTPLLRDNGINATFRNMRQCQLTVSQGGFHKLDHSDYITYQLVIAAANRDRRKMFRLISQHPVWHSMCFIPTLNVWYLSHVVAAIRDPRWFVGDDHPGTLAKIQAYMGLIPGIQQEVSSGYVKKHAKCWRCMTVLHAWQPFDLLDSLVRIVNSRTLVGTPGCDDLGFRPGDFLLRVWAEQYEKGKPYWSSDLRASRLFLRFLRDVWLATVEAVRCAALPDGGGGLFRPEDFFSQDVVACEAYKHHMLCPVASPAAMRDDCA